MLCDVAVFHGDLIGTERAQMLQNPAVKPLKFDVLYERRE